MSTPDVDGMVAAAVAQLEGLKTVNAADYPREAAALSAEDRKLGPFGLFTPQPPLVVDVAVAERLIAEAKAGDMDADNILRANLATILYGNANGVHIAIPPCLLKYAAETLKAGIHVPEKTRREFQKMGRDSQIVKAVHAVSADFGIPPTRGDEWRGNDVNSPSACSIVARALAHYNIELSDVGVEKIWERKKSFLRP